MALPMLPAPFAGNNNQMENTNQGLGGYGTSGGMIGTGIAGLLGGLFGGGDMPNPSNAAQPYLNQIPNAMSKYLNPYVQSGQNAMNTLQGQYSNLVNDPSKMLAQFGQNFQQDPGYQWNLNQNEQAITNAAAAGGMAGSPMHQQQAAGLASNLANQQYQNYLQNVLGLYGQGLGGYQGINQMGYGASNQMAEGLAQALMQQANLAYAGQANQNQANQQQEGGFWGGLGSLIGGIGSHLGL